MKRTIEIDEDAGGWISMVGGAIFFISSMICIFG